jgi:hypothetical protein
VRHHSLLNANLKGNANIEAKIVLSATSKQMYRATPDVTRFFGVRAHISLQSMTHPRHNTFASAQILAGDIGLQCQHPLHVVSVVFAKNGALRHFRNVPSLKPGARLVREWRGRTHTVTVTEDGFEYAGENYPSLTKIAKKITGAHWSGPRFFGLLAAGAERPSDGAAHDG